MSGEDVMFDDNWFLYKVNDGTLLATKEFIRIHMWVHDSNFGLQCVTRCVNNSFYVEFNKELTDTMKENLLLKTGIIVTALQ